MVRPYLSQLRRGLLLVLLSVVASPRTNHALGIMVCNEWVHGNGGSSSGRPLESWTSNAPISQVGSLLTYGLGHIHGKLHPYQVSNFVPLPLPMRRVHLFTDYFPLYRPLDDRLLARRLVRRIRTWDENTNIKSIHLVLCCPIRQPKLVSSLMRRRSLHLNVYEPTTK